MAQNFTYTELVELVPSYAERQDTAFIDQVPTFISLAENRIATELKQQGFQAVVTGTLPLSNVMGKPSFWRETISFSYKDASNEVQPIQLRSLEYCKNYWPNSALTGSPKFYADYNFNNFLLVPTPSAELEFELAYYARLQPLGPEQDANWLTLNAPQALLYAIMFEAMLWSKNSDGMARWQPQYESAKAALLTENAERMADRGTVVTRA